MSKDLIFICGLDELTDPESRGFSIEHQGLTIEGFIVRYDDNWYAYRNSCPHTGAPLDWVEHQFLDADDALIQCAVHDARFLIDTGECISGPCHGKSLQALPVVIQNDGLFLELNC